MVQPVENVLERPPITDTGFNIRSVQYYETEQLYLTIARTTLLSPIQHPDTHHAYIIVHLQPITLGQTHATRMLSHVKRPLFTQAITPQQLHNTAASAEQATVGSDRSSRGLTLAA